MAPRQTNSAATTGYETELWAMADALRSALDAAENIFWVPPEARWARLKAEVRQPTIGQPVDRTHRELTGEEIRRIADSYHAWKTGDASAADLPGFCKSASLDALHKHGHVLTPGRYVGVEPLADDGEHVNLGGVS